ncbi:MAG: cytochrome ubiquinol oxidase subunit I [Deltaproteobacteria bacterium]|jgi:cytochrome d ubiquinol oxidase subunit I|nr:cytochrome ubiquinol oxidase subunit I [Deltaproteobacteria bacterium]
MDPIILSRLQFAVATIVHFFYVPLTIGLGFFIAIMETRYVKTGDEKFKKQAQFWGRIFLINFVLGVVTGIALEFQFGTNWALYSKYVGDIFGSLLAIEATLAFFLESTFIGIWAFGWNRVPKKVHLAAIWLVAFASTISALWILLANGFMQHPVGYEIVNNVTKLSSFSEVLTNPYGWMMYLHTVFGAFLLTGFVVMGVSAWHLFVGRDVEFFSTAFRLGSSFALIFSILLILAGHQLGQVTAKYQKSKFAAMEAVWETQTRADMHLIKFPHFTNDEENNVVEALPLPGFLSFLADNDFDYQVTGLKDIPKEDRPLIWPIFYSFRLMVGLGTLFFLVAVAAFFARSMVSSLGWGLWVFILIIPLPYLALQLGWVVTEMGRQPWVVFGLLRTAEAGSPPVAWYQVLLTLLAMIGVYAAITITGFTLMIKSAISGPQNQAEHYV